MTVEQFTVRRIVFCSEILSFLMIFLQYSGSVEV